MIIPPIPPTPPQVIVPLELAPDATPELAMKALADLYGIQGIPLRSLNLIHTMFMRYEYAINHPNPRPTEPEEPGAHYAAIAGTETYAGHTTDHRTHHDTSDGHPYPEHSRDDHSPTEVNVLCPKCVANNWFDSAVHFAKGEEFYRDELDKIGLLLSPSVYVSDDGSQQDKPLRAKIAAVAAIDIAKLKRDCAALVLQRDSEWKRRKEAADIAASRLDLVVNLETQLATAHAQLETYRSAAPIREDYTDEYLKALYLNSKYKTAIDGLTSQTQAAHNVIHTYDMYMLTCTGDAQHTSSMLSQMKAIDDLYRAMLVYRNIVDFNKANDLFGSLKEDPAEDDHMEGDLYAADTPKDE